MPPPVFPSTSDKPMEFTFHLDDEIQPVKVVPLIQAPWFQKKNLNHVELAIFFEQFVIAKKCVVDTIGKVGAQNFFMEGHILISSRLPPDHPFYFAQMVSKLFEDVISVGLDKKSPFGREKIKQIVGMLFQMRRDLFRVLGLKIDWIIYRLWSVGDFHARRDFF